MTLLTRFLALLSPAERKHARPDQPRTPEQEGRDRQEGSRWQ